MNKQHLILENLHINEAINTSYLDRFIKYCKAANVKDIGYVTVGNKYYIYGISDKRFEPLAKSFVKANSNKIVFEYSLDGSTEILKLETKIS